MNKKSTASKDRNAPNQSPIKYFWTLFKMKYKQLNMEYDTIQKFTNTWMRTLKKVSQKSDDNLFTDFKSKLYDRGHNTPQYSLL